MGKKIVMEFEKGGKIIASLLEKEAPATCRAILNALPVEHEMIHAMWAGEEVFFDGFPAKETVGSEHATTDISPGDLAYNGPSNSFCIFYGRGIPRSAVDQEIELNVFARCEQVEEAAKLCKRIRRQGIERVKISLAGE